MSNDISSSNANGLSAEQEANVQRRINLATTEHSIKRLREQMKELSAERTTFLPRISAKELAEIVEFEEAVEVRHSEVTRISELRKGRSITEEDKDQIDAAKVAYKKYLKDPTVREQMVETVTNASYVAAYRLTHRKDGKIGFAIRGTV